MTAAWKPLSMVDVKGAVTFTLWLCGCNLKCPFCHNWRLAESDRSVCGPLQEEALLGEIKNSLSLIDYVHITGGEPLVQAPALAVLLGKIKKYHVKISVNSNLTLPSSLKLVLPYLDHVATDVKLPEFYGVDETIRAVLFRSFLQSLDILKEAGIALELRVPYARGFPESRYQEVLTVALEHSPKHSTVIWNKLLGPPLTDPRDKVWCEEHCFKAG